MIYILLLITMIIATFLCKDKEKNTKAFWIFGLILTLLLIFRYGQGSDFFNYEYIYSRVNSLDSELLSGGDIGFKCLIIISKYLGFNYIGFNMIIGAITMILTLRGIDKLATNKMLSLTIYYPLYYVVYAVSAVRQGLAMAIFIGFLLIWLLDKKFIKYGIGVIIASSLHMSAIFLLALIPIRFLNFVKTRNFVTVLIALIAFKFLGIQTLLLNLLPISLSERASNYLNGDISISALIIRIVFLAILFYLYNKCDENTKNDNKQILNIYISGFFVYIFFMNSPLISSRLSAYIKIVEIILFGNFLKINLTNYIELMKFSCIAALMYIMLLKNISSFLYQGNYFSHVGIIDYPYVSIFDKDSIYRYRNLKFSIHLSLYPEKYQWPIKMADYFNDIPELEFKE